MPEGYCDGPAEKDLLIFTTGIVSRRRFGVTLVCDYGVADLDALFGHFLLSPKTKKPREVGTFVVNATFVARNSGRNFLGEACQLVSTGSCPLLYRTGRSVNKNQYGWHPRPGACIAADISPGANAARFKHRCASMLKNR
jgi:hypothetical protein